VIRIPSRIWGVKWEPVAAMIALLFVGLWLVYKPAIKPHPGGRAESVLIANERGIVEGWKEPGGEQRFQLTFRNGHAVPMSEEEVSRLFGPKVSATLTTKPPNRLFRLFNITGWTSLVWVAIGMGGQILFAGRTLVQWFASEKERRSVVPAVFWWMSLIGGVSLFAYFAWRQDVVGVLGQCSGVVIYARNLRLIAKHKRREERLAREAEAGGEAPESNP